MGAPFRVGDKVLPSAKAYKEIHQVFGGQPGTIAELGECGPGSGSMTVVLVGGLRVFGYRFEFRRAR